MTLSEPRSRLALALLALAVWSVFAAIHMQVKAADFYVFWTAARHPGAPYDPALIAALRQAYHFDGQLPFVYPPTLLIFAWPFGQLPLGLACPLWTGLSAALFTYAAAHLVRPVWATLALFVAPPVVLAIAPGQTSLALGAAMIAGWLCLERRPALAGVLIGLVAAVKPQAMLVAPILLWGHWRAARWAVIAALALALASLVFGPGLWIQWLQALADFSHLAPATDRVNPSAIAPGPLLTVALLPIGAVIAWRSRDLAGLIVGGLCATPYAHQYDLAPLAPLALTWLLSPKTHGWPKAAAGAALLAGAVATPWLGLAFVMVFAASTVVTPAAAKRRAGAGSAAAELDVVYEPEGPAPALRR